MIPFLLAAATLIGGKVVDRSAYPAIIYIQHLNQRCTASVIGPSTIITAGHCVNDHGTIGPAPRVEPLQFSAHCRQAPLYRSGKEDHDISLCQTDRPLQVKYASISAISPAVGDIVELTGFGCTSNSGSGSGGNNGILKVGYAPIVALPVGKVHDFIVKSQDTTLCFGDSGGPAFLGKYQIGVNSKGNLIDRSEMIALWGKASLEFMHEYIRENKEHICGINLKC